MQARLGLDAGFRRRASRAGSGEKYIKFVKYCPVTAHRPLSTRLPESLRKPQSSYKRRSSACIYPGAIIRAPAKPAFRANFTRLAAFYLPPAAPEKSLLPDPCALNVDTLCLAEHRCIGRKARFMHAFFGFERWLSHSHRDDDSS
jgi:hypothetical protein